MSLLCCLYLSTGLSYMFQNPYPSAFAYWRYDIAQVKNPYGVLEVGWHKDFGPIALEFAGRHESSIPVNDFGQNTLELRLRWYPFGAH